MHAASYWWALPAVLTNLAVVAVVVMWDRGNRGGYQSLEVGQYNEILVLRTLSFSLGCWLVWALLR